jgi:glycosyltransferase involved in cell wall biosynthesis
VPEAVLFLHVCPTGETGCDIRQLVRYFGLQGRVILAEPNMGLGDPEERLRQTYNVFDVMLTTTQGEGFGLPTLEGMACGVPQIVPDWSALGDWAGEAAYRVPCTSTSVTPGVNVIGGIAGRTETIAALDLLYRHPEERSSLREAGLRLAAQPRFHWEAIGEAVGAVLQSVLSKAVAAA